MSTSSPVLVAYEQACSAFLKAATHLPQDGCLARVSDEWSVRDLIGHISLTLQTTIHASEHPVDGPPTLDSPAAYFTAGSRVPDLSAEIAERGRQAAIELGEVYELRRTRVLDLVDQAIEAARSTALDQVIETPRLGTMRFGDYLDTRTFELVVHTLDLDAALVASGRIRGLSEPADFGAALPHSLRLVADLASASELGIPVLLALTGRGSLSSEFSLIF